MGHGANSPSCFFRRMACPGSKRLEEPLPQGDNEYTLRGTAAHQVGEFCLTDGDDPGEYDQPLVIYDHAGQKHEILLDDGDIRAIAAYVDYVKLRESQLTGVTRYVEASVHPSPWLNRQDDCDGTADCILRGQDEKNLVVEIIDYKHGAGLAVEAVNNPQLVLYALGACAMLNIGNTEQRERIRMTIVQPRASHPKGPIRSWEILAYELYQWIEVLTKAAAATDAPDAPLIPGDHCRWCKANPCEAVKAQNIAAFKSVSSEKTPWEEHLGRPVDLLSVEQLTTVLDNAEFMTQWLKDATQEANRRALQEGAKFPGYKLVLGNKRRKWIFSDEEIIKKLSALRDTRDPEGKTKFGRKKTSRVVPISITQAEKDIKPYTTERQWKSFSSKNIARPKGAPVLAPVSDARPAIQSAETVFEDTTAVNSEKAPWE